MAGGRQIGEFANSHQSEVAPRRSARVSHCRAKALEATCWLVLWGYEVVFREVLDRETIVPKWREVLITLRRLED